MSESTVPTIVEKQVKHRLARRILRDGLLRPIGFNFLVKPNISGLEHVPQDGPLLLVMNHIALIDPVVVVGAVTSRFVVPMSKIENFKTPGIGLLSRLWGAYPVHRDKVDRQALQNTLDLLKHGHCVLIAPEGTRQPKMIEAKEGFTYVATKANCTVVPIGLEYTDKFGNRFKQIRPVKIDIRFGRGFRFKTDGRSRIPRDEMRQMTQEAMYQMAQLLDEPRRGYYSDLSQATTETIELL